MLKGLIKLANHLDKIGRTKEADYIDSLITKKAAAQSYPEYVSTMRSIISKAKDPKNPGKPLSDTFRRGAEEISAALSKVKDAQSLNDFITKFMAPRKDKYPYSVFYSSAVAESGDLWSRDFLGIGGKSKSQKPSTSKSKYQKPSGRDIGWAIITNIENTDFGVKSVSGVYSEKLVSMKKYKKLRNPDGSPKKFKYTYDKSRKALENTILDLNKKFDFGVEKLEAYDSENR